MAMYSTYGVHRLNLIHSVCVHVCACESVSVCLLFFQCFICRGWQVVVFVWFYLLWLWTRLMCTTLHVYACLNQMMWRRVCVCVRARPSNSVNFLLFIHYNRKRLKQNKFLIFAFILFCPKRSIESHFVCNISLFEAAEWMLRAARFSFRNEES